nr:site-specific integrase [uncultured Pseudodesulfovibrio sp.]
MASKIKRNGRTRWKGRVQKQGEIKTKLFDTKTEALAWETKQRKADWSKTDTIYSLGEWAQDYMDYGRKYSAKTYGEKKKTFKEFFAVKNDKGRPVIDPAALVETLTPGKVLNVLQAQFEARSGYAANKDRKNLVAAWNWGIRYRAMPQPNPCLVDKFPEVRTPRYVPPEEDFWKVYNLTSGQDKVMLSVFLYLGARRGEVFRLAWEDIDFVANRIRLSTRKRQAGSLEYDWLPMTDELKNQLLWWWESRKFKDSEYVFVCEEGYEFCRDHYGKPFQYRQQFMKKLCKIAKVKPFGFHGIRHLTASILFRLGHPVSVIQAILRHKSASTTERYLKTLGLEETRSALESLSGRGGKVIKMKTAQSK